MLQKFIIEYGHAKVPRGRKFEGFPLDIWISTQRRAHLLGKLSEERKRNLESLPVWVWNTVKHRDESAFQALDSFVQREGHAFVPTNHIENEFPLGKWVSRHRLYYAKGNLEDDIRLKLESYPNWFWNAHDGYWEKGRRLLLQFCDREGHSIVKGTHIENGFELGQWVGIYRYHYKKNKLSQEKVDFFNSLPCWSWDVKADQWNEGFEILRKFVTRTSHAKVPATHIEEGFRLGTWVNTNRYSHSKGKLTQEKIKLLEQLPDWTWSKSIKK